MNDLPGNCTEMDIAKRFGDEIPDEFSHCRCESCGTLKSYDDLNLVCPEDGIYLCNKCLKEVSNIDLFGG
jgi:NAD-dependent SIR2 family protein deacetylase